VQSSFAARAYDSAFRPGSEIVEASQSLLGGVYRGLDNDTLAYDNNAPLGYDGSYRRY
jgi:hypothetical protein